MKKMFLKSTAGMLALALAFVFVLGGCAKEKDLGVYDKTVPADQSCTLVIVGAIYVKEFDGARTKGLLGWTPFTNSSEKTAKIQIPAGNHTLKANFNQTNNYGTIKTKKPMELSFDFQPGKTYRLFATLHLSGGGEIVAYSNGSYIAGANSVSMTIEEVQ